MKQVPYKKVKILGIIRTKHYSLNRVFFDVHNYSKKGVIEFEVLWSIFFLTLVAKILWDCCLTAIRTYAPVCPCCHSRLTGGQYPL